MSNLAGILMQLDFRGKLVDIGRFSEIDKLHVEWTDMYFKITNNLGDTDRFSYLKKIFEDCDCDDMRCFNMREGKPI